jgi:hypothetical protein
MLFDQIFFEPCNFLCAGGRFSGFSGRLLRHTLGKQDNVSRQFRKPAPRSRSSAHLPLGIFLTKFRSHSYFASATCLRFRFIM